MSAGWSDEAVVEKDLDLLLAEPFDVECEARHEMLQALLGLRWTDEAAGAATHDVGRAFFIRLADGVAAAGGTDVRELDMVSRSAGRFSSTTRTICGITSPARCTTTVSPMRTSLRAISSSLCSVALETTTPPTVTGCQLGDRRQRAGAADLDLDLVRTCRRLLGRELVGDGPTGRAAIRSPAAPVRSTVDLVDDAVDVVAEARAFFADLPVILRAGLAPLFARAHQRVNRKTPPLVRGDDAGLSIRRKG